MALILAFDTSGHHCAAALLRDKTIVAQAHEEMAKGQAERLMGALDEVLMAADATWADLTAIGVGIGPGNFTGIRISVAAARGLALGLSIPAIGVSTFEAYAPATEATLLTLPAPRDTLYVQPFHGPEAASPPRHIPADKLRHERWPHTAIAPDPATLAQNICHVARTKLNAGTITPPKPLYVKAPDAAPPRDAGPTILS